ncbi:hypothetical protein [Polluticoccus soli]|uniref:hypothetical protein n=1 Tax=Polluticoccus soli TaxID=3034150 RepID=UPI0023E0E841|nr:hypothetical protein [Flavipsychrobacter sp. JY13-12]
MAKSVDVTVKMFQVGELGDCFLLTFNDKKNKSNVLIDCGTFRNSQSSKDRLEEIVTYIKSEVNGHLDVVIGTHQHNDHMSGFCHCEEHFQDSVSQVWLSWLDDPRDAFARQIRRDEKKLTDKVQAIGLKLHALNKTEHANRLHDMLGFYSVDDSPGVPARGIEVLKKVGKKKPEYLSPGQIKSLPGIDEESVKVYVLGPPRRRDQLFSKDPDKTQSYDPHLALANGNASRMLSALDNQNEGTFNRAEDQFPFNQTFKKKRSEIDPEILAAYDHRDSKWRKIDDDWLGSAARLGIYLDSYTNNSSLVLAFELVRSGKVLLFAADAQTGNWVSWEHIKWADAPHFNTYQLLQNTVLYKVGHHGSHNATLVKALEAMEHPELVAMIPVDKTDSNITKPNGWKMPAKNLYRRLKEKTNHRVLRMDYGYDPDCSPTGKNKNSWRGLVKPKIDKTNKYIEYTIQG